MPRPTAGRRSPLLGMARARAAAVCANAGGANTAAAVSVANSRRVIRIVILIGYLMVDC